MAIAGGLRGAPVVRAVRTITCFMPTPRSCSRPRSCRLADLAGRPLRRVHPPDGRAAGILVRIKAISSAGRDLLQSACPGNTWLAAPTLCRDPPGSRPLACRSRRSTSRSAAARSGTPISMWKQPGEGKNALLAALGHGPETRGRGRRRHRRVRSAMEWAIATRVQGDKDVMIVGNAAPSRRSSLPQGYGVVPTGAKVGTPPSPKASRANTTSASPTPMPTRPRSPTT